MTSTTTSVPVTPPGGEVRFRVRESAERVGSSWKVLTTKATGDVYVCHRDGARWIKTSFHETGQWHYSVMHEGRPQLAEGQSTYIGVTKERPEIASGWLHALRITVPLSEFRDGWRERAKPKNVIEVPVDPNHDAVTIDMFLLAPDASAVTLEAVLMLIGHMQRGDGGQVVIAAYATDLDGSVDDAYSETKKEIRASSKELGHDGESVLRAVGFGHDVSGGFFREIELAVDPE